MTTLLTVAETAAALNVTERWVRRGVFEGRFDVIHVGRLVRIPSDVIEEFIESNRQTARRSVGSGGGP